MQTRPDLIMRYSSLLIALASVAMPLVAQTIPKKQLVEEVRIDGTTEDFPDVGSIMVSPRGEMAVMVSKDQQFRFYDAMGKKLGTFGRMGSGSGEFRRVTSVGWTADTLWIYDSDQRRVTYISPDLKLLRTDVFGQSLNQMENRDRGTAGDGAIVYFVPRAVIGGKYVGATSVVAGKTPEGRPASKARILAVSRDAAV